MDDNDFHGKRVLILGLGKSGQAAARFLLPLGAELFAVDKQFSAIKTTPEAVGLQSMGLSLLDESRLTDTAGFDAIVVSPGVPHNHPLYLSALAARQQIIGEAELAFRFVSQPVLGITGTNGKTTVTLLIEHVLRYAGLDARALGNVGTALTAEVGALPANVIIVAELSSYQLETMSSKVLTAAAVLNITPDHLDRYESMTEYAATKFRIKDCLKPKGNLYVEENTYREFGSLLGSYHPKLYGFSPGCNICVNQHRLIVDEKVEHILPSVYRGSIGHDVENLMAAYALCREVGVDARTFMEALDTFKKPPHRIEFVGNINNVAFYDDSKGTNIDAVVRAVGSLPGKIILIAGGVHKGASYQAWAKAFADKVKCILAIGQAAPLIEGDLKGSMAVEICPTLESAVAKAAGMAQAGDKVLLSPGCSSFDMFRDYAHRGDEFKRLVNDLKVPGVQSSKFKDES